MSYEELLNKYLECAPEEIDKREGSIFYDAGAAFVFLLSRFYADLEDLYEKTSLPSATGEYLDGLGRDYGLERHPATAARYKCSYEFDNYEKNEALEINERFFTDGHFFVVVEGDEELQDKEVYFEAEKLGVGENDIAYGTPAASVNTIIGLKSVMFREIASRGHDAENDDEYRKRIREKLSGPAENGNRQHYKTWCMSVDGVGSARIIPTPYEDNPMPGEERPNTIIGVILDTDGGVPDNEVIRKIQTIIDPNENGDGSGLANIGAKFTAMAPISVTIDISFSVTLDDGYKLENIEKDLNDVLCEFIQNQNLNAPDNSPYDITTTKIGALILCRIQTAYRWMSVPPR